MPPKKSAKATRTSTRQATSTPVTTPAPAPAPAPASSATASSSDKKKAVPRATRSRKNPKPAPAVKAQATTTKKPRSVQTKDQDNDTGSKRATRGRKRAAPAVTAEHDDDDKEPEKDVDVDDDDNDARITKKKARTKAPQAVIQSDKLAKLQATKVVDGHAQIATQGVKIPLDDGVTAQLQGYQVYIDDTDGVIFDASLNQTNAGNNNNKFYRIQLLHRASSQYCTWTRWGRVGDRGQHAVLGSGTLQDALRHFHKKFKDKSGLHWDNRNDPPRPKKYTFVERSYVDSEDDEGDNDDDDDDNNNNTNNNGKVGSMSSKVAPPAESKLAPAVQELLKLIFNQQYFQNVMSALHYDVQKLPLGKLSKTTLTRGFEALKAISILLNDPAQAQALHGTSFVSATEMLSNSYFSLIPHVFGRQRPPVIRDNVLLKQEVELLESLSDMKEAAAILKHDIKDRESLNELDRQYQGLGMEEMTPLVHTSNEFQQLEAYLKGSVGSTHDANYKVDEIFRIERRGEQERFDSENPLAGTPKNRRLLWHGSRCTNFGGILSQGLRIAPPEAPVSGYMFGKGIYLADMSSKSANYCCAYNTNGNALLLVCEAELGDPMLELTNASYNAGEEAKAKGMYSTWGQGKTGPLKWKDAGCVHPSLAGVQMPDISVKPGDTKVTMATLIYNEYIVYNVAQVRLRYLIRMRM